LTTVPGLDALSALVRFFVLDIESSVLDESGIFCSSTSFSTSTMTSPSLSDSILYCNQTKKQQEEESNRMRRRSPKNDPELVIESFPSKIASLVTFDTKSHSGRRHAVIASLPPQRASRDQEHSLSRFSHSIPLYSLHKDSCTILN
jgi:hypothetical protein